MRVGPGFRGGARGLLGPWERLGARSLGTKPPIAILVDLRSPEAGLGFTRSALPPMHVNCPSTVLRRLGPSLEQDRHG